MDSASDPSRFKEETVRRLAAALRASILYAPTHPLVERGVEALDRNLKEILGLAPELRIGFVGDEVVVDEAPLRKSAASLVGFVRNLKARGIERIALARGISREELRTFVRTMAEPGATGSVITERLAARGVRSVTVGRLTIEEEEPESDNVDIAAARQMYGSAVTTAQTLWDMTKAGEKPDPNAARKIIDGLARMVTRDRTSLVALTALKKYDNYTFTHMVNVSILSMAQARSLGMEGPLLREFGFAALMHDIGKVKTPLEVLNKPDKLTREEFQIMKQHVIDGAHILRKTPEMPTLAPIVAFEHHLKMDLTGYPEKVGARKLNLGTMIVSIADVYDALRSNRPYRDEMPTGRILAVLKEQHGTAFEPTLVRRFIHLMGIYPVGNLVRLDTDEIGLVSRINPADPFRPQVKILFDRLGQRLEDPPLANLWETGDRGDYPRSIVEPVDAEPLGMDPLTLL